MGNSRSMSFLIQYNQGSLHLIVTSGHPKPPKHAKCDTVNEEYNKGLSKFLLSADDEFQTSPQVCLLEHGYR